MTESENNDEVQQLRNLVLSSVPNAASRCDALRHLESLFSDGEPSGKATANNDSVARMREGGDTWPILLAEVLALEGEGGSTWRVSVEALEACERLAGTEERITAPERAWLCAQVLRKAAQPQNAPGVEAAAVAAISALWFDDGTAECANAVLDLDELSTLRCLALNGCDMRVVVALAARSGELVAKLVGKNTISINGKAALSALGGAIASAAAAAVSNDKCLLETLVARVACDDAGWHALEPVLVGFFKKQTRSSVAALLSPVTFVSLFETLTSSAALEGDRFFDAEALENWPYLGQTGGGEDRAALAAEAARNRALGSLGALVVIVERIEDFIRTVPRKKLAARLRAIVIAAAGWLGLGPPEQGLLDVPWASSECSIRATQLLMTLDAKAPTLFGRERCNSSSQDAMLINVMRGVSFGLDNDAPHILWAEIRARLSDGQWKKGQWQGTAALCALVRAVDALNARDLIGGNACVGEVLPLVLPLTDASASQVRAAGATLLFRFSKLMTPTEVRWHAALLLNRANALVGSSREPVVLGPGLGALLELLSKAEAPQPPWTKHVDALDEILSLITLLPATTNSSLDQESDPVTKMANAAITSKKKQNASISLALALEAAATLTTRLSLFAVQFFPRILGGARKGVGMGGDTHARLRSAAMHLVLASMKACRPRIHAHQAALVAIVARNQIMLDKSSQSEMALAAQAMAMLEEVADLVELNEQKKRLKPYVPALV